MPQARLQKRKKIPKRVLALPDLEHAKSAVLSSLTSRSGQRTYDHAIREFVGWYCSEPRLAFNRTGVVADRSITPRPSRDTSRGIQIEGYEPIELPIYFTPSGHPARCALHRLVQIPIGLQAHPELGRGLEELGETQGRVRRNPPLAKDDLVQAVQ